MEGCHCPRYNCNIEAVLCGVMTMQGLAVARPQLQAAITSAAQHRIAYIGGAAGWGKSWAVRQWLQYNPVPHECFSALDGELWHKVEHSTRLMVIDDVRGCSGQLLADELKRRSCRFILIGRGRLPAALMPYYAAGEAEIVDVSQFPIGGQELDEFVSQSKLKVDADWLVRATGGYPLLIQLALIRLRRGESADAALMERVRLDMFRCFDGLAFMPNDAGLRSLLFHMAPFEEFSEDMAIMVTGRRDVGAMLSFAVDEDSYLCQIERDRYRFPAHVRDYLMYRLARDYPDEFRAASYHNAGLYYELHDDLIKAMECYQLGGETEKICELLMLDSQRNPGNGHYYQSARFYMALPEERLQRTPELMCGMSMMHSLMLRAGESERWYGELERFSRDEREPAMARRKARELLAYLQIALPHRGSRHVARYILAASRLGEGVVMPEFSVTSSLPSVLNGGKDFCEWTRHDEQLYRILRVPCDKVLGRCGAGMPDIALAESKLVKCDADENRILRLLNAGIAAADARDSLDMTFAGSAVMMRLMVAKGDLAEVRRMLSALRERAARKPLMLANIRAFEAWVDMLGGAPGAAAAYVNDAPNERECFMALLRYQYIVKVRAYIQLERFSEAEVLLLRLLEYCESYARTYGQMEALTLLAICLNRMGRVEWREVLNRALTLQREYGFVRIAAEEGAALSELLAQLDVPLSDEYGVRLTQAVKRYAVMYPLYLKRASVNVEPLTASEREVLQLLCSGLSNAEIAQLLGVRLRTVKFHLGNVYSKLGVKTRVQAIARARELDMFNSPR